jgi:hypothetical protein
MPVTLDPTDKHIDAMMVGTVNFPVDLQTIFAETTLLEAQGNGRQCDAFLMTIADAADKAYTASIEGWEANITLNGLEEIVATKLRNDALNKAERLRRETRDKKAAELADTLKSREDQLDKRQAQVDGLLAFMPSPTAYLEVVSMDTAINQQERVKWEAVLANASYAALLTRVGLALATNNIPLAAAITSRLWAMKNSGQSIPIGPGEFARRMVGAKHQALVTLQMEIRTMRENLAAHKRRVLTGNSTKHDLISRGLRQRKLDAQRAATAGN